MKCVYKFIAYDIHFKPIYHNFGQYISLILKKKLRIIIMMSMNQLINIEFIMLIKTIYTLI